MSETDNPDLLPPRADLPDEIYATLRDGFVQAGYSRAAISELLDLRDLSDFFEGRSLEEYPTAIDSPLSALCQEFLLGRAVEPALLRGQLGDDFVDAALAVGLLVPVKLETEALAATASVYPVEDLWMASDRVAFFPGVVNPKSRRDVVYPAATRGAANFLRFLPRRKYGRFLETCGGCGPAAVIAGRFAEETVASDLEPRSAAFAAFNGRLAGLRNFQSIAGSFYDGADGLFDCITAHPPYMPSLGEVETYYGGGEDGSEVLRGLVIPLPEKLAPGGIFYAETMMPRQGGLPYTRVLREWIGDGAGSFDIGVFVLTTFTNTFLAMSTTVKASRGLSYQIRLLDAWKKQDHTEFALVVILIRRHQGTEVPIDCHRIITDSTTWQDPLRVLEWEKERWNGTTLAKLMEAPVTAAPGLRLHSTHEVGSGGLTNIGVKAAVNGPFETEAAIDEWMAFLFARADGTRTGEALMASLVEDGVIPPETPPEQFAQLLSGFVGAGFLRTPICPRPWAEE